MHSGGRHLVAVGLLAIGGGISESSIVQADPVACTNGGTVTTEGAVVVTQCDGAHIVATATGETATLTIDSAIVGINDIDGGPVISFSASDSLEFPTDLILNLTGSTTVNPDDYDGVDVRTVRGDITVNIGEDVTISPDQTGVYVLASDPYGGAFYEGGNVKITNYGTVTAGAQPPPNEMGTNGIAGLANGGGVEIWNYGTVTTTYTDYAQSDTYGIYADGGKSAAEVSPISIYNYGTVSAMNDGLRVAAYNGLATAVNGADGVVTSNGRRGIVVWSATNAADLTNQGIVIANDGPGINVWAGGTVLGDATVENSGSIVAHDNEDRTIQQYKTLYNGAHIWSQAFGKAELLNRAGGSIEADDGWGVWMQSTDGDVIIDNAGRIKGETVAIHVGAEGLGIVSSARDAYKGAMGGRLDVDNSGLLTAFGAITDEQSKFGLVTLAGDVTTAAFTNAAGGIVGAGIDLEDGFDVAALQTLEAGDFSDLFDAAANRAIFAAIKADTVDIENDGLLFGRVVIDTPEAMSPDIGAPDTTGAVEVTNSGTWIVSGLSSITGSATSGVFRNSGVIWALDKTGFGGDFANEGGVLSLVAMSEYGSDVSISGDYAATGHARVALRRPTDIGFNGFPGLSIRGDVTGRTEVLIDVEGAEALDWSNPQTVTLVTVEGDALEGAAHFYNDQRYGLSAYGLDYVDDGDHTWSLTRGVNTDAAAALSSIATTAQDTLDISMRIAAERLDDLRDLYVQGDAPTGTTAYGPTASGPAAFAAFDTGAGARSGFAWFKASALTSSGDGYDSDAGVYQGGVDLATRMGDDLLSFGVFGGYGRTDIDFDAAASGATVDGPLYGVYGSYLTEAGLFFNGALVGQSLDIEATLSSVESDFDGQSYGGRAEAGMRLDRGGLMLEPSLALQAGHVSFDTVDVAAIEAGFEDTTSLATEARLRVSAEMSAGSAVFRPFATFMAGYEFLADNTVVVESLDSSFSGNDEGLYGDVGLGLSVGHASGAYAAFVQGNVGVSDERTGAAVRLGGEVRF